MSTPKRYSSASDALLPDGDDEEAKDEYPEEDEEEEDSDGSRSSDDPANLPAWLNVDLPFIRTDVQCPICLGIIKKTRTMMDCLHRFCRECIDKSMRLGNNECPACRTHCASRRSLRDDPRFDNLIEGLYDIDKYEEEELAFREEERTHNMQIQASIAQISQLQSEAVVTRRKMRKDKAASTSRLSPNYRNAYSRRRRRRITRGIDPEVSGDNEEENNHDGHKNSSSSDEQGTEFKPRRYKRRAGAQPAQPSTPATNSDGGGSENDNEASREKKGTSESVWNPEVLAWGGGGARSKSFRNTRIMKLTKYIENLRENDYEFDVHLMLFSLDKQRMPSLQHPNLCCPPQFSVEGIKEYVAHETQLQTEDIEILLVKKHLSANGLHSNLDPSTLMEKKVELQILEVHETLAGLTANYTSDKNHLILAYRLKERD